MVRFVKHCFWATVMLALVCEVPCAQAGIINFDEIDLASQPNPGTNYNGINWSGANSGNLTWALGTTGTSFGGQAAHSGDTYAFNSGGNGLYLTSSTSGETINLYSFWAMSGDDADKTIAGVVRAYFNGSSIDKSFEATNAFQKFVFDFTGATKIEILNISPNILLDDLDVTVGPGNVPGTPTVPEPASLLVWGGMGLASVLAYSRRKFAAK